MDIIGFLLTALASMIGVLLASGLLWLIQEFERSHRRKKWRSKSK